MPPHPARKRHTARLEAALRDETCALHGFRHIEPLERPDCDVVVAALAAKQHGTVSTEQLLAAGLTEQGIRTRVAQGRLHRLHRGVYAVGHLALPPLAPEAAAILACGPGTVISHHSAAAMWGLTGKPVVVDVTVPTQRRSRTGLRTHRSSIERSERRSRQNIPLTSPYRTLRDLARCGELSERAFDRALTEALFLRLISDAEAAAFGSGDAGSPHEAEDILNELILRSGLPKPLRNIHRHGKELDFFWPDRNFNLELDGFRAHGHRIKFEKDRARDLHLRAHGIEVLRVTWRMLVGERDRLLVTLAKAVA